MEPRAAGRVPAARRERADHADRRDHRESVVRGDLGAALADAAARAAAAVARKTSRLWCIARWPIASADSATIGLKLSVGAIDEIVRFGGGDARRALGTLEIAAEFAQNGGRTLITPEHIRESAQQKALLYDRAGEEHYNVISAFIKSMRGSDPDAAVYWMMRMVEAGEDPLFIARRMVIFASEDVGNADPRALQVAIAVKEAVDFVGMPEGVIPLAQGVTYLASAPKSNASYLAMRARGRRCENPGALPVPLHLRNAPTPMMEGSATARTIAIRTISKARWSRRVTCPTNSAKRFTTSRPSADTKEFANF